MRDLRKHTGWYLTGYPVGGEVRRALATVDTLARARGPGRSAWTRHAGRSTSPGIRGTQSGPQTVTLPANWVRDRWDDTPPPVPATAGASGG